jgi:hypothetical protein
VPAASISISNAPYRSFAHLPFGGRARSHVRKKSIQLRARRSTGQEFALYRQAALEAAQTQGDLLLAYLVELDDLAKAPRPT